MCSSFMPSYGDPCISCANCVADYNGVGAVSNPSNTPNFYNCYPTAVGWPAWGRDSCPGDVVVTVGDNSCSGGGSSSNEPTLECDSNCVSNSCFGKWSIMGLGDPCTKCALCTNDGGTSYSCHPGDGSWEGASCPLCDSLCNSNSCSDFNAASGYSPCEKCYGCREPDGGPDPGKCYPGSSTWEHNTYNGDTNCACLGECQSTSSCSDFQTTYSNLPSPCIVCAKCTADYSGVGS